MKQSGAISLLLPIVSMLNQKKRIIMNLNDQWHRVKIGFATINGRKQRSIIEHQETVERIFAHDGEGAE